MFQNCIEMKISNERKKKILWIELEREESEKEGQK